MSPPEGRAVNGYGARGPLAGLRVLELTQRFAPALGGVERYVERLAKELTSAGARVEVSTSDLARDQPMTRGQFSPGSGPVAVRRHRAYLAAPMPHGSGVVVPGMVLDALRSPVDVVHAHAFGHFPLWVGALSRALRGTPLVVTTHSDPGSGTPLARLWSRYVVRTSVRSADRIVALSRLERDWLAGLGAPRERIHVIPPGIDVGEFAALPARLKPAEEPVILFVGRLSAQQKGLGTLVRAFAKVPRGFRSRLRLVGADWGGLDSTLALARSLGVSERVEALGAVSRERLVEEYASAELLVLPSRFDSFPVVVLEAMAAGLPVVATRVGGVPEAVEEGKSGLLVPPEDPAALAEGIRTVLADPELRVRFGAAGRERAARFDWSVVAAEYVQLFREVSPRAPSAGNGGA